ISAHSSPASVSFLLDLTRAGELITSSQSYRVIILSSCSAEAKILVQNLFYVRTYYNLHPFRFYW
ncbi:MAG: hypothetical protein WCP97_09890, partial [bacterium]